MGRVRRKITEAIISAQAWCPSGKKLWDQGLPLKGEYLLTGVDGLLLLNSKGLRRLLRLNCFGIAVSGDDLFVSHTVSLLPRKMLNCSMVLSMSLAKVLAGDGVVRPKILWGHMESSFNGRIHQIAAEGDCLWLANTDENTLIRIRKDDGALMQTVAPFADEFGLPLRGARVHHINSVSCYGGVVFFTAFYPFSGKSLVGVFDNESLACFEYPNEGAHDIHVSEGRVYVSDSFGPGGPRAATGGFVVRDGAVFPSSPPVADKPYMVRGFVETKGEFVVGLSGLITNGKIGVSHQRGGVAVWDAHGDCTQVVDMPFSQCNDLIRTDGLHFETKSSLESFDDAATMLEKAFGSALFVKKTQDCEF